MNLEYYKELCHSLAKATLCSIRLYQRSELLYYYSVYHLHPDPMMPFVDRILNAPHKAGIFVTPLYQFYGYLTLTEDCQIIIGPTNIENEDRKLMDELLFLLEIPVSKKKEYEHLLYCAPNISIDRMSWLLSFVLTSITGTVFPVEKVYMDIRVQDYCPKPQAVILPAETSTTESAKNSYNFELLLFSYIEHGQPQNLEELYSSAPSLAEGKMAADSLRQKKNAGICCAAIASRAAIAGGMDSKSAFQMSDLYIQKFELIRDIYSAEKLIWEMMIDYAVRVQQIQYNTTNNSALFQVCANYISQNIYNPIRTEDLAKETGYTRTYLCNQFKKQTGITLTQYILQEKIIETKRMLQFTDKSLSEIATQFSFSSQSHFQSVFKKMTGETPLAFRQRMYRK